MYNHPTKIVQQLLKSSRRPLTLHKNMPQKEKNPAFVLQKVNDISIEEHPLPKLESPYHLFINPPSSHLLNISHFPCVCLHGSCDCRVSNIDISTLRYHINDALISCISVPLISFIHILRFLNSQ